MTVANDIDAGLTRPDEELERLEVAATVWSAIDALPEEERPAPDPGSHGCHTPGRAPPLGGGHNPWTDHEGVTDVNWRYCPHRRAPWRHLGS